MKDKMKFSIGTLAIAKDDFVISKGGCYSPIEVVGKGSEDGMVKARLLVSLSGRAVCEDDCFECKASKLYTSPTVERYARLRLRLIMKMRETFDSLRHGEYDKALANFHEMTALPIRVKYLDCSAMYDNTVNDCADAILKLKELQSRIDEELSELNGNREGTEDE